MTYPPPITASTRIVPSAFRAWRRKDHGARWWIIATGETDAECLRAALTAAESDGPGHGDLLVLSDGQEP